MHRRDVLKSGAALAGGSLGVGAGGSRASAQADAYGPLGSLDLAGAREVVVSDDGRTAYAATNDGYATVDVASPDSPQVLAHRADLLSDHEAGPLVNVQDVKVDGETLVVVGPAHSRPGTVAGLLVVDVSDPTAPVERSFFETSFPIHNCDLSDGHAYLTGNGLEGNPLVVVDIRDEPTAVGRWSLTTHDAAWKAMPPSRRTLHDVFVRDGVAYCALWDAGTWLVDVSDPTSPAVLGSVDAPDPSALSDDPRDALLPPGNHHYSTVDDSGDVLAVGKETFAATVSDGSDSDGEGETVGGPSGIDLWDVADPTAPGKLSTIPPPPTDDATRSGTWTTAHNLELRAGTLYSAWYQGGVKRHDVSVPADPREESWWRAPTEARFWTAQAAVTGDDGYFVASSMGLDGVPARLYTFPDQPGEQVDPPSLNSSATETSATQGSTGVDTLGIGLGSGVAAVGLAGWTLWRRRSARR